jgi:hypothetical protein
VTKFLVTYHGGTEPDSPEAAQQVMAAFMAWAQKTGSALVDPGAPLGPAKVVSSTAVTDGAAEGPVGGYSIIKADDLDAAVALVADHPFVGRGGELQVSTAVLPD